MRPRLMRAAAAWALIVLCSIPWAGVVTANTVSATVLDGDASYTFNMNSADLAEILSQAQGQGLPPLGPLDVAERVGNTTTVNVRRGVRMRVTVASRTSELVAYQGDTVYKALCDNNILINEGDVVSPGKDMVIQADLAVEVKRSCQVTVDADGKVQALSMTGGTVADALGQAGLSLGEKDACNYGLDEPLFNGMHLRVSRRVRITVKADGKTQAYEVPAERVEAALKHCGVKLGEDDRLNVKRTDRVAEGMAIVIQRVRVEEKEELQELDFPTRYEYDDTLFAGEEETETAGEKGQKRIVYKVTYVDGVEESREVASQEVVKEPVGQVIRTGTRQQVTQPGFTPGGSSAGGVGTFTDNFGNTVSYARKLVGPCTAYSVPGGTTSIGLKAEYGIIAVDPSIIPYGTRLYVASADGSVVYGYGVAGDTGGALLDGTVIADLCYNTIEECSYIGRREMVVYILP